MQSSIKPPEKVLTILRTLKEYGCAAYAVGGCIRDHILGREPKDWDIATNALPFFVKDIFDRTVDTGIKHGTVSVILDGEAFEVTTFRIEGNYIDCRRPQSVEFTGKLEDDLRRRDFTMNAMAWNEDSGIIDPFGGMKDIQLGLIRAVGDPSERFGEDALRIMRAVRFAARLGFEIEERTLQAAEEKSHLITNISSERIREELTGMLTSDHPMKLTLLRDTGILKLILPEVEACFHTPQNNPHHIYDVGEHTLHAVAACASDLVLRWVMLLHDIGKPVTWFTDEKGIDHYYGHPLKSMEMAKKILGRLKFDNKSTDRILRLVRYHDREIPVTRKAVAKAVNAVGEDIFLDLLKVKRADKHAQAPKDLSRGLRNIDRIENIYFELKRENRCLKLKDMAIDGNDLLKMGFRQGREVGRALGYLFEKVLEDPSRNEKQFLAELAAGLLYSLRGK